MMTRRIRRNHFDGTESDGVVMGDISSTKSLIFLVLFLVMLMLANITKDNEPSPPLNNDIGKMMIEIGWDAGQHDVDLWLREPGSKKPVGYSNRAGKHCDLLRDDLGTLNDPIPANIETIICRNLPEGDYTINLFFFSSSESEWKPPLTVGVVVSIWNKAFSRFERKIIKSVRLEKVHDQKTVVSFIIRSDGTLDESSINDIPQEFFREKS